MTENVNTGTPLYALRPSANEIQHRRFMRAPDGHEGSATPPSATPSGNNGNGADNTGGADTFKPEGFWNTPAADPAPASQNGNAATQEPAKEGGGFDAIQSLVTGFKASSFMTPEVVNKMGENDFTGFDAGLQAHGQQVLQQSTQIMMATLKEVIPALMSQMQGMVGGTLGERDTKAFLESKFTAAKDPSTAPVVRQIFDQAMSLCKGDKTAAEKMTRTMLQTMGNTVGRDVNLEVPANNGRGGPAVKTDWFDELGISR